METTIIQGSMFEQLLMSRSCFGHHSSQQTDSPEGARSSTYMGSVKIWVVVRVVVPFLT